MEQLSIELLEKRELNEKFSIRDLLKRKDDKMSDTKKKELVFKLDFFNVISKDKTLKSKFNEIDIDFKEAKRIKREEKISFSNNIKFLLTMMK